MIRGTIVPSVPDASPIESSGCDGIEHHTDAIAQGYQSTETCYEGNSKGFGPTSYAYAV